MSDAPITPSGEVVGLFVATREGEPTEARKEVLAVAGKGLEGDRYFGDSGVFEDGSKKSEVTLIESEAVAAVARDYGIPFQLGEARRNIVTRGVPLNHLVDQTFRIGDAMLKGQRLCEPCTYLEGLTRQGVRKALVHRGGLRARIVAGGSIRIGDPVRLAP